MAKNSPTPLATDALLAECLNKGLAGDVRKLQGGGASPGFFPAGAKGLQLAKAAREKGLIEDVPAPKGRTPHARLTERGRQFVVDYDDPKRLLGSLQAAITDQGQQLADGLKSVSGIVNQWQKDLQQQQHDFQQALQTVNNILVHLKEAPTRTAPSTRATPPSSAPSPPERPDAWQREIVELVRKHKSNNSYSRPTLTEIYQELARRHPRLTIGQFHDGLRILSKERQILLTAYTLALATLEDPQTALYLDREVKYYVDLP